jgi:hypothetical protein
METYRNGKIYKIVNTIDDMVYIGSTVTRLCDRMGQHRRNSKKQNKNSKLYTHIKNIGIEHFKILLIKSHACNSKDELESEEFKEMNNIDKEFLLNENVIYKQHSENHNKKIGDSQRGEKSHKWKYGSVFKRSGIINGYPINAWCFSYQEESGKAKRFQYSIKRFGDEEAYNLAIQKQKEIFPNSN